MRLSLWTAIYVLVLLVLPSAALAQSACAGLDWTRITLLSSPRALTPEDLVRLRDVGPLDEDVPDRHVLSLSPDRRRVAFHIRQAEPGTNSYCQGMAVITLDGSVPPRFVDYGGELIFMPANSGVEPIRRTGLPEIITPRWSGNGFAIFYRKKVDGITQVWRAQANGSRGRPVTSFDRDVVDFRITGQTLVAQLRGSSDAARSALAGEARRGFHLDERFIPMMASSPSIPLAPASNFLTIDLSVGQTRDADAGEIARFDQNSPSGHFGDCEATTGAEGSGVPERSRPIVRCGSEPLRPCAAQACSGISGPIWFAKRGSALRFMRREGWARTRTIVYEWMLQSGQVRPLYATTDYLIDCQPREEAQLLCLRETSTRPRHLVLIGLDRGDVAIVADFNPEFRDLSLGRVNRVPLKSDAGIEAFGDVVLPVGYRAGQRYPLIVVQYQSRGFLRGGTGDEFPIQAFANQGFAVLSIQRPMAVGALGRPKDYIEVDRINLADFVDRRSVLSVIEQGVRLLIDRGIADPRAIGITGLSDGSSTVQYAALHSHLFSAAVVSGCCWESSQTAEIGPTFADLYYRVGWPRITDSAEEFWSRISLVRNARRVAFPILFEMADEEYRLALESYTALREVGRPTDFFVFPDEHHIKWQPAHRLAAYWRGIDWFEYWLRGSLPQSGLRRSDADRWIALSPPPASLSNRSDAHQPPFPHPSLGIKQ